MYSVGRLFRAFTQEFGELPFLEYVEENPNTFASIRYREMMASKNADKMVSSIYGFMNVALYPFDISEYHHIFDPSFDTDAVGVRKKILDIESIGEKRTVLFINVSDTDHSCDALVNLFYTQALQTLVGLADNNEDGRLKVPVRFMMDDFASNALIPDFDKIPAYSYAG